MVEPAIHTRLASFRRRLRGHLDPAARDEMSRLNRLIALLIIIGVVLGIIGTEPVVQAALGKTLLQIELVLGALFLVELLARLWTEGLDERYAGFRGVMRNLGRPLVMVDVLVIVSLVLPSFGAEFAVLRVVRVLRLIALAKFGRYSMAMRLLAEAIRSRRYELKLSMMIAVLVFLFCATGMYIIEGENQPQAFGSIPRALWWSMITLTTVGYGDVYPVTALGKVFAGFTALAGIGLIAMPTGIIASAFSEIASRAREE